MDQDCELVLVIGVPYVVLDSEQSLVGTQQGSAKGFVCPQLSHSELDAYVGPSFHWPCCVQQ